MVKGRFAENERNYIKSVRNYTLELKMKAAQAEMQCWKGSALRMAPLKDVYMFCNVCVIICSLTLQVADPNRSDCNLIPQSEPWALAHGPGPLNFEHRVQEPCKGGTPLLTLVDTYRYPLTRIHESATSPPPAKSRFFLRKPPSLGPLTKSHPQPSTPGYGFGKAP